MIISSISDVHISDSSDNNSKILHDFFMKSFAISADFIILNGDIFDILIGGKKQYLKKYSNFFKLVKSATDKGLVVIYLEGNHDFHIEKLINDSIKSYNISSSKFKHVKSFYDINVDGKLMRFTHGDDVEIENEKYQSYKRVINNKFVKFLGDYIVPFSLIEKIGHDASKKSRENNLHKYELSDEGQAFVKDKFRRSAKAYFKNNNQLDGLICGHSHCKDFYKLDSGKFYINNGYAPAEKTFIKISKLGAEFINL